MLSGPFPVQLTKLNQLSLQFHMQLNIACSKNAKRAHQYTLHFCDKCILKLTLVSEIEQHISHHPWRFFYIKDIHVYHLTCFQVNKMWNRLITSTAIAMVKLLFTDLFIVTLSYHEEEAGDANPSLFFLQEYDCDWCNFVFTLKPDIKQYISPIQI